VNCSSDIDEINLWITHRCIYDEQIISLCDMGDEY